MKHKTFWIILCLFITATHALAQNISTEAWLSHIADERLVSSLSLPGAHDATTGEGLHGPAGIGKTQSLTLSELWDSGVRVFDLRPAVKGTTLHIYHGHLRTRLSFDQALCIIRSKLIQHPSEFAIILIREEGDSENTEDRKLWPLAIGKSIEALGEQAADFSPNLTVGALRGKILILSRTPYIGTTKGALLKGWSHSECGNSNASIIAFKDSSATRLQVQDYYATSNSHKRANKLSAVTTFLKLAQTAPPDTWTINHLSGYSTTWLQTGHFATSSGYKRNATWLHHKVIAQLANAPTPYGIIMMDYVGVDHTPGSLFHWSKFNTIGKQLVQTIILSNFP